MSDTIRDEKLAIARGNGASTDQQLQPPSVQQRREMTCMDNTRRSSPDMPDLEPLNEPCSEDANSVPHGWSVDFAPARHPPSQSGLAGQQLPSGSSDRRSNFAQTFRNLAAPLKLSLVLENKGNVARDHLASERTYLAYVRTSLACASAGVVQLFTLTTSSTASSSEVGTNAQKFARPLGATVVLFGIAILFFGLTRYFTTQAAMLRGFFPVARNTITLISLILATLVSIILGIVLAQTSGS
ncbi:hypothetical protein ID866_2230 [Astraeus odoratus]|nr:hypothetical protein ID866_2230 [Astraeus odoratus]